MKIISDTADLSDEYMEYLSEYTVQLKDICINNRSISDDVEIVYIDDSEEMCIRDRYKHRQIRLRKQSRCITGRAFRNCRKN